MNAFDIVFLSYGEPEAEGNFQNLLKRFPKAKRLHGVTGLARANRLTAEMVDTEYYFLVDADNEVLPHFDFYQVMPPAESPIIQVWKTENAVNGLKYGYGGIKLCHRDLMRVLSSTTLDPFLSVNKNLKFIKEVASVTRFNTSPFDAWKAGFRECCLLTIGSEEYSMTPEEVAHRLTTWQTVGEDKAFGEWAIRGAIDGHAFANSTQSSNIRLQINNFEWLHQRFIDTYGQQQEIEGR